MSAIVSFVEKYIQVSTEERKLLEEGQVPKRFRNRQVILSGVELNNFGVFVVEGMCYLQKMESQGDFKVMDFYFQGEPILNSFGEDADMDCYSLHSIKNCSVLLSDSRLAAENMVRYPKFERVCRIFAEEQLRKSQKISEILKLQDPAEKLISLMQWKPEILHCVPKQLIASFLGMRAETLSRVTSRFLEN